MIIRTGSKMKSRKIPDKSNTLNMYKQCKCVNGCTEESWGHYVLHASIFAWVCGVDICFGKLWNQFFGMFHRKDRCASCKRGVLGPLLRGIRHTGDPSSEN